MQILAGDIGGTKTRLALFEAGQGQPRLLTEAIFPSAEHDSLEAIVRLFLKERPGAIGGGAACFGLAGPVRGQRCSTTNLPWQISARRLQEMLGEENVWLINDLEANAWGIPALGKDDLDILQPGDTESAGNACIIAAGSGLGEAGLQWDGYRHRPFATEGGHTDFAPRNALEFALLESLAQRFDHVSWERLVSGPGLSAIYRFLCGYRRYTEPTWLAEARQEGDAPAAIASAALQHHCPVCVEALDLFVKLYGAEAGNLALKHMATGGVFIGGGIAPKILPKLQEGGFLQAFNAKGRMEPLLRGMPVSIILNDRAALYGAACYAALQLSTSKASQEN